MADKSNIIVPLALGAGALWLLSQLKLGGGAVPSGGPSGAGQQPLPPQPTPGGGPTPSQISATIGAGTAIIGGGIGLATKLLGGGAIAGGGAATTTTTTTTAATAATTGAETGAESAGDVAAAGEVASVAGAALVGGYIVAAYVSTLAAFLAINIEGSEENDLTLLEVGRSTYLPGLNRFTGQMFMQELALFEQALSNILGQVNIHAPPFPDLNKTVNVFNGYGGYSGRSRRLGRFGGSSGLTVIPGLPKMRSPIVQTTSTALTQALTQANSGMNLISSWSPATPMPDPNTPYGFTRCGVLDDSSCGVKSSDPTVAAYAQILADNYVTYYVNSVDPRLPAKLLMRSRAFYRWMAWTGFRQMNACLNSYYTYKDTLSGCWHPLTLSWGGCCFTVDAQGNCADRTTYSLSPSEFESAVQTFYSNMPAMFQPPTPVPWSDYQTLNGAAAVYMDAFNQTLPKGTKQSFDKFSARVRLWGTVMAATQASLIGFGTGIGWSAGWPGDPQFTAQMLGALGLKAQGWGWANIYAPDIGPNLTPMAQDPATGFWLDFVGMHNKHPQTVYRDMGASPGLLVVPIDTNTLINPSQYTDVVP